MGQCAENTIDEHLTNAMNGQSFYKSYDAQQRIRELESQVATLQIQNAKLAKDNETLSKIVDAMQGKIDELTWYNGRL